MDEPATVLVAQAGRISRQGFLFSLYGLLFSDKAEFIFVMLIKRQGADRSGHDC